MRCRDMNRIGQLAYWGGLVFVSVTANIVDCHADPRPCRGFTGTVYSRKILLERCGEPDEVLVQEPKRLVLWRYKNHPYVVVRGTSLHDSPLFRDKPPIKRKGDSYQTTVDEALFRRVLDEASEASSEGQKPGQTPPSHFGGMPPGRHPEMPGLSQ
jgi:hypothetical protein